MFHFTMPKLGGNVLHSQGREIVFNEFNYFYNNQEESALQSIAIDKIVETTKISKQTE